MPAYIDEKRDGRYILDVFDEATLESWSWRVAVDTENVASHIGVGDVVSVPTSVTRDKISDLADEETRQRIHTAHQQFEDSLATYAKEYGVDIDTPIEEFTDGDLLFLATPPADEESPSFPAGETLYATPEGFLADGMWVPVNFAYLVGCARTAIDAGLFFEVVEVDEHLAGLRYVSGATQSAQQQPLQIYFNHVTEISELEHIDAESDLEPPLYVMIHGYDDGVYNAHLYDSATPPSDSKYESYRRVDSYGTAKPPYLVDSEWPYSRTGDNHLIPVEEITFDEKKDPPRLFAIVSPDDETVIPERR